MDIQNQIDEINKKLDILLDEMLIQKSRRQSMDDLVDDLNIIGKDAFNTAVVELDKAGIEVDSECVTRLGIKLLKNTSTFNQMIDRLESINDFLKDAEPIVRQMGLDTINKLAEFERKGYFEYLKALAELGENIIKNYSAEDIKLLSENTETIFNIVKNLTNPEFLKKADKITNALNNLSIDDKTDNKSLFKILKEINSPEVRKTLSYSLRLIKDVSSSQ